MAKSYSPDLTHWINSLFWAISKVKLIWIVYIEYVNSKRQFWRLLSQEAANIFEELLAIFHISKSKNEKS